MNQTVFHSLIRAKQPLTKQYHTIGRKSMDEGHGKLLESHGSSDKYPKSLIDYSHHFNQIDLELISEKRVTHQGKQLFSVMGRVLRVTGRLLTAS